MEPAAAAELERVCHHTSIVRASSGPGTSIILMKAADVMPDPANAGGADTVNTGVSGGATKSTARSHTSRASPGTRSGGSTTSSK